MRLTKDSKENKGFAFVTFADKEAVQRAIEDVQDREYKVPLQAVGLPAFHNVSHSVMNNVLRSMLDGLLQGRTLRGSLSQAKHRLFVGNVPKGLREKELRNIIKSKGQGVVNIEMFKVCFVLWLFAFLQLKFQVCANGGVLLQDQQ